MDLAVNQRGQFCLLQYVFEAWLWSFFEALVAGNSYCDGLEKNK
jgi:hypothetical protein